jgi:hypothetical protein
LQRLWRSTRSIAKEVRVQPQIVSHWRSRYAEQGLASLDDKPRPGKKPLYTKATDKWILGLLDKPPPDGLPMKPRIVRGPPGGGGIARRPSANPGVPLKPVT